MEQEQDGAFCDIFRRRTCIVVCGASRGLGECIAKTFAAKFQNKSCIVLLARNIQRLDAVKSEINAVNPGNKCVSCVFNQSDLQQENFDCLFEKILKSGEIDVADYEQAIVVHSAGNLGDITKFCRELSDVMTVRENFDLNVSGTVLLNTAFLKAFPKQKKIVINLSSLAAVQPIKSWSLYCSSKAARDMYFKTLAAEEPDIQVLSYAPGPCDTEMQKDCREKSADTEVRAMFQSAHSSGQILSCQTSIDKLCLILQTDFESGAHVDYYDAIKTK